MSSSGGEIAQLYNNLQLISTLVGQIQIKTETLRNEAGHARGELREVEYLFYRITSLLSRLGLPPEIERTLMIMQRLILTIRMVHTSLMFMESTTSYGFIMMLVSLGGGLLTATTTANTIFDSVRGT